MRSVAMTPLEEAEGPRTHQSQWKPAPGERPPSRIRSMEEPRISCTAPGSASGGSDERLALVPVSGPVWVNSR